MTTRSRSTRSKATPAPRPTPQPPAEPAPGSPLFLDPEPAEQNLWPHPAPEHQEESRPLSSSPDLSGDAGAGSGSPFGTPSTPDASAKKPAPKITRASVRKYAGIAVAVVLGYVAETLTKPDSVEREAHLWEPDAEDLEDMADPVAGLVARRLPQKAGAVMNPDVEDGLVLALALAKYVGKQWQRRAAIKARLAAQPVDLTAGDLEGVPA